MDYEDYYENPFDGMDYDEILQWAATHQDELLEYGIDPSMISFGLSLFKKNNYRFQDFFKSSE